MLHENIKTIRKSKGLSQQELAAQMNVVRQTVSKWKRGLSVPDSDMLILLSGALDTPVSILLGEKITEDGTDDLQKIRKKLEIVNFQLAQRKEAKVKYFRYFLFLLTTITIIIFILITMLKSSYLEWNYNDPQRAVLGVILHGFEWAFVRITPIVLLGLIFGIILTKKIQCSIDHRRSD